MHSYWVKNVKKLLGDIPVSNKALFLAICLFYLIPGNKVVLKTVCIKDLPKGYELVA